MISLSLSFLASMQLFILPEFQVQWKLLTILDNEELFYQINRVLRMKVGDEFFLQTEQGNLRYQVALQSWSKEKITAQVLQQISPIEKISPVALAVAVPNHTDKLELILQKSAEIWITDLYFWPAERSQKKQRNEKKLPRYQKILKEASEQSWSWQIPQLHYLPDLLSIIDHYQGVVFEIPEQQENKTRLKDTSESKSTLPLLGIIGPEGGLTPRDYQQFGEDYLIQSLWSQVLRMETAAIIGAWLLRNR